VAESFVPRIDVDLGHAKRIAGDGAPRLDHDHECSTPLRLAQIAGGGLDRAALLEGAVAVAR
jgi:hypothetical protein